MLGVLDGVSFLFPFAVGTEGTYWSLPRCLRERVGRDGQGKGDGESRREHAKHAYMVKRVTATTLPRGRLRRRNTRLPLVSSEHFLTVAVALGTVAVAIPSGSYSIQARAVIAVLVWWVVVGGVVLRLLPRAAIPREAVVALASLTALATFTVVSIAWASDNGGAYEEGVRAVGYAGLFALVVLASPGGSGRSWLTGLAIGLTAVSALALVSRMIPGLLPDQGVVSALPETAGRLSYPLGYWNALGATLALGAVLLIALAGTARSMLGRAAATAAIPMPALALFLTSSRGASIALAVGLVLLFVFGRERLRMAVATAIGGVAAGALVLAATARDLFIDGRTGAAGFDTQAHEMLLLTLVAGGRGHDAPCPHRPGGGASPGAAAGDRGRVGRGGADPGRRAGGRESDPALGPAQGAAEPPRQPRFPRVDHEPPRQHREHGPVPVLARGVDRLQERADRRDRRRGLRALVVRSTARWTTSCGTRTRCRSRSPRSWGWWDSCSCSGSSGR